MRAKALATAAGSSALLLCLLASASAAQGRGRPRAPSIRVFSENGAGVVSSYVRPIISVSEDAYVFAVMMDLDGHIQVLQPDFPGISVRIRSQKQLRLPSFFAGFNYQGYGSGYSTASYNHYSAGVDDSRGTVIALASRVPFRLELIEANGDWNMIAIRDLIDRRSPESAAQSLARYLGATGEPIGRDFMRFAGGHRQSYYAYNSFGYACGDIYGYGYRGDMLLRTYARFAELRALGLRPVIVGYDQCGTPLIIAAPTGPGGGFRPPPPPPQPQDTTVFPKTHFPQGIARRPTPEGVFPLPDRAEQVHRAELGQRPITPQIRDVTITAPRGRRAEPREIIDAYREALRSQPGVTYIPERAPTPVGHAAPARSEPAASGMRPTYRPEPRVTAPSEPARPPERARAPVSAPPPVVHERPSQPSSPPPRAETHSKPEPTTAPPPQR